MYNAIFDKLQDKVTDIFIEMQDELGITCGDCAPLDEIALDDAEGELAEIIADMLKKQMEVV